MGSFCCLVVVLDDVPLPLLEPVVVVVELVVVVLERVAATSSRNCSAAFAVFSCSLRWSCYSFVTDNIIH